MPPGERLHSAICEQHRPPHVHKQMQLGSITLTSTFATWSSLENQGLLEEMGSKPATSLAPLPSAHGTQISDNGLPQQPLYLLRVPLSNRH